MKFKFILEQLNPFLIRLSSHSISFSLSDRFLLFQFLNQASRKIEDNPYLNFVSVIKNYKIFGNILSGTIHDFYRDRNKSYFVNFFTSKDLYKIVKSDIERVHGVRPVHGHNGDAVLFLDQQNAICSIRHHQLPKPWYLSTRSLPKRHLKLTSSKSPPPLHPEILNSSLPLPVHFLYWTAS